MPANKKWTVSAGLVLLLSSFTLVSCSEDATDSLNSDFGAAISGMLPNLWVTLTQLVLFIATVAVVFFFAYKPIKKKLTQRQDYIVKNIKDSESRKSQAEALNAKAQDDVAKAQLKAGEIIGTAQKTAEQNEQEQQRLLADSIEKQKEQAHRDIEAERSRMLKEAHNQIVDTAIDASKKILGRETKEADSSKIVNDFIDQLEKGQGK